MAYGDTAAYTVPMKHLQPKEAFEYLRTHPEAVFIDVRSEWEYLFVGHPKGAILVACQCLG